MKIEAFVDEVRKQYRDDGDETGSAGIRVSGPMHRLDPVREWWTLERIGPEPGQWEPVAQIIADGSGKIVQIQPCYGIAEVYATVARIGERIL